MRRAEFSRLYPSLLLLIAALAGAYSNSFQGEFIFDDVLSIEQNASIQKLWPLTTPLWPGVHGGRTVDGRPLLNLSLAINYAISGLDVWSYHVLNLAIHVGGTLFLYGLVRRTLLLPKFHVRFQDRAAGLAFAIALLWGLHPLNTEAVSFVVQRAESMAGLFYLATLYCIARGENSPNARLWQTASVAACLAGMATKETVATAPLVAMVYLWVFVFDSLRETLRRRWLLLAALLATWLPLALLLIAHSGRGGSVDLDAALSPFQYACLQMVAIVHYLKLSFWPRPLVFDYGRFIRFSTPETVTCGILLLILAIGTLWALAKRSWIGFLGSAFFLILAPSSSVVPIITQVIAERRMYLPLAAVVTLVVVAVDAGCQWLIRRHPKSALIASLPTLLVLLIGLSLGIQTWRRNLDYRTALALWTDVAQKHPANPRAHLQLAVIYQQQGNRKQSVSHLDRAIQLNPNDRGAYFYRGALHLESEHYESALHDFDRCLQLSPGFAEAYQNRGLARLKLGDYARAIVDLNSAIELGPQLTRAYHHRALAYAALNRPLEARLDAQEFVRRRGESDAQLDRILTSSPK